MVKKIIALVLTLAIIISCFSFPAFAEDYSSSSVSFWDSIVIGLRDGLSTGVGKIFGSDMGDVVGKVTSNLSSNLCGQSSDGLHHADTLLGTGGSDSTGQYVYGKCKYCGDKFKCYSGDFSNMYSSYVSGGSLNGSTSVNSAGQYKIYLSSYGALYTRANGTSGASIYGVNALSAYLKGTSSDKYLIDLLDYNSDNLYSISSASTVYYAFVIPVYTCTVPSNGTIVSYGSGNTQSDLDVRYWASTGGSISTRSGGSIISALCDSSGTQYKTNSFATSGTRFYMCTSMGTSSGGTSSYYGAFKSGSNIYFAGVVGAIWNYGYSLKPWLLFAPESTSIPSSNTRITNRITNIYNISNSTTYNNFFNEENNTYIDMSGTSYTVNNWEYDYSSRFYSFDYTDSDETNHTVVITYADDFVTVTDNGTTNYYYYGMPSSSGDGGSGDSSGGSSSGSGDSSGGSSIDYTPAINDIIEKLTTLVQQGEHDAEYQEKVLEYLSNIESYDKQTFDTLLSLLNNVNQGLFYTAEDGTTYTVSELAYYIYNYLKDNLDVKSSVISGLLEKILTAIENISPSVDVDIDIDGDGESDSVDTWFSSFLGKFAFIGTLYDCGKQLVADVTGDAASAQAVAAGEVSADDLQTVHVASVASVDDDSASSDADIAVTETSYTVPEMLLNFPSVSWHGVNMGNLSAINLSWYSPYKSTVDNLVSGFLWLAFIWLIFKRAPSIIQGAGMAEETALKIDSYNRR